MTSTVPALAPKATVLADAARQSHAAEALYREHYEFVWRNARRLGASEDWVDDAVHEVFLVATRRLDEFEGRSSVRTWLFGITYRVVLRARRDRARQRQHLERYVAEHSGAASCGSDQHEQAQYLRHLLQQLPDTLRAIVILAELEGFTTAEIAESLAVPRGTVDSRLRKARLTLARCIDRDRAAQERLPR